MNSGLNRLRRLHCAGPPRFEKGLAAVRANGPFLLFIAGLAILLAAFGYCAEFYLSLSRQYLVGWGCVLLLVVCNRIERCKKPPLRLFFVMVALFINARYLVWRTTETLVYDGPADFVGMGLLYAAELYAIALHLLGVFTNIWPLDNKIVPLPEETDTYPTVDILLPTYNEDPEIVRITALAAKGIDYPPDRVRIHILDDGGTVAKRNDPKSSAHAWDRHYTLRRIARELGVNYLTRERNVKAKAGNLNHALGHTSADLVLILDCDHVPTRDILRNTVGWFLRDEKLAFVQTPHFFINPNPIEKNLNSLKDAPSENELFYRANHPGLNFWNASFFCGSAAILRRTFLLEVGGIAGETITEDCETALALHQRGYNSVYISRPMVCGLSPETFDDFILQRSRWAQGMTQLMVLKNPLFAKGLSFSQRLCYFNNGLFWFFGISRFIFFIAPAAFLLLGLHVYFASVNQVVAYALPHIVSSIILTDFFYGRYRWPFLSELYEIIQSIYLIPVVLSVFANPRKPSFLVTPKGKNLEQEFFSALTLPFLLMCLLLLIAIPAAVVKWQNYPLYRDVITITLVWALYNLIMAMASLGAFFERKQIRSHHRLWSKGRVLLSFPRLKSAVEARVEDVSLSGAGLSFQLPAEVKPHEHVEIIARDSHGEKYRLEANIERIRRRGDSYFCGSAFQIRDPAQFGCAVQFVYSDSQRWVDHWHKAGRKLGPVRTFTLIGRMALQGFKTCGWALFRLLLRPTLELPRRLRFRNRPVPVAEGVS